MGIYERKHWEAEFAGLVLRNIQAGHGKDGVYDPTQALMSLLALTVLWNERDLMRTVPDLSRTQMRKQDWPVDGMDWHYEWNEEDAVGRRTNGLHAFLRMMRHSLAHAKFEFWGDEEGLSAVQIVNDLDQNRWIRGFWVGSYVMIAVERLAEMIQGMDEVSSKTLEARAKESLAEVESEVISGDL